MPMHTPSPHRFLAPAPLSAQNARGKPQSQSGLRHGVMAPAAVEERRDGGRDALRVTPAKRFVVASPRRSEDTGGGKMHTQAMPALRPRVDSIDESSPSSSANVEVREGQSVLQSIEPRSVYDTTTAGEADDDDDEEEILFVTEERNKRRRVSPQPASSPSPSPAHLPHTHIHTPAPASHRFKVPAQKTPAPFDSTSTPAPGHTSSRPHFILPRASPSPSKAATPLPETFSPSRKNGKYIPNGLASTLQSWIIETAESGYAARSTASGVLWGRDRDDGVRIRVKVGSLSGGRGRPFTEGQAESLAEVEAWPGGVVFVRGTTEAGLYNASRAGTSSHAESDARCSADSSAEIRVLLTGQGGARGKGGVKIRLGSVVGVKAPVWDVDVVRAGSGEKWLVGVEWVVLS